VTAAANRPSNAIRHARQALRGLGETHRKLNDALDSLRARKALAAQKIEDLIASVEKQQAELGEIIRLLEDDSTL
jgi:hypothetical protein